MDQQKKEELEQQATQGSLGAILELLREFYSQPESRDEEQIRALAIQAERLLIPLANQGDVDAMFNLGWMYHTGKLVTPDIVQAKAWWEKAAALGNARAMLKLGGMYYWGELGARNMDKAKEWWVKAADHGNTDTMFILGLLYQSGALGAPDMNKAEEWYEKAADHGNTDAMLNLGGMYYAGELGTPDMEKAKEWWEKAVEKGEERSLAKLLELYTFATEFKKEDLEKLKGLISKNKKILYLLSSLCRRGVVENKVDEAEAENFYFQALNEEMVNDISNPLLDTVFGLLKGLPRDDYKELCESLGKIGVIAFFIKNQKIYKTESEGVTHFTSVEVLENLFYSPEGGNEKKGARNRLRYSPYFYMNDPNEGRSLFHFMLNSSDEKIKGYGEDLKDIFSGYEKSMGGQGLNDIKPFPFLLCFTKDNDRLDLWRAYGRDGEGVSIKIPLKKEDVDEKIPVWSNIVQDIQIAMARSKGYGKEGKDVFLMNTEERIRLYGITYLPAEFSIYSCTPKCQCPKCNFLKDIDLIRKALNLKRVVLRKVKKYKRDFEELKKHIDLYFASCFIEVMYLYKDNQYSTEKEVRAITLMNYADPRVKLDTKINRIYSDSSLELFTHPDTVITLGPKVNDRHLHAFRHRAFQNPRFRHIGITKSKVPYR